MKESEYWDRFFAKQDPWNHSSEYEQVKYRHTLELLPADGIARAIELGCAEGMFTAMFAPRVGELVAVDIAETALQRARARCAAHRNVTFLQHDIAAGVPGEPYDLVVCAETVYYLRDRAAIQRFAADVVRALRPGGRALLTHANMVADDRSITGFDFNEVGAQTIGEIFAQQPELDFERELRTELYRVQLFRRREARAAPQKVPPGTPRETLVRVNARFEGSTVKWGGCIVTEAEAKHCWVSDEVPVLMYHRIADDGPEALTPYRVRVLEFERQLAWLQRYGYRGITLDQLYRWRFERKLKSIEGKPIVLTFDDAYVDFYEHAYPLLRHYGFPATVFVPTAHVGRGAEWDSEHGPAAEIMSWDQIAELSAAGVQFGSHSRSHRRMTELTPEQVLDDANASKAELTQRLGVEIAGYCYPFGAANPAVVDSIRRAGYRFAVRGLRGERPAHADPFQLPRIEVFGTDGIESFVAKLPEPKPSSEEQRSAYAALRSRRDRGTYMDR